MPYNSRLAPQLPLDRRFAESNAAARALYAACGFTEAGRRKAYYTLPDGGREDAFLLTRDLVKA